ncbi:hypothetical protein ACLSSQ_00320 [Azospira sp. APE16]|uniref:hypothetical protein n=1 Tax=Azospira sp. APE16 TaxID=3394231 RepID=UPI003A4D93FD
MNEQTVCPHCQHVREENEQQVPSWQCPGCGRKYYEKDAPSGLLYPASWKAEWRNTDEKNKVALVFTLAIALVVLATNWGRLPTPSVHNSQWDGSVYQVEAYLKSNLRDPDSYQGIAWGKVTPKDGGYSVYHRYRAKNGFGGYVVHEDMFFIDQQGNVRKAVQR